MIWYGNTNHLTVGPVNVGDQLGNNANWEPYCGVLGDSAFLLGYCSYAPDGVANPATAPDDPGQSPRAHQQYYVTVVPTMAALPRPLAVSMTTTATPSPTRFPTAKTAIRFMSLVTSGMAVQTT